MCVRNIQKCQSAFLSVFRQLLVVAKIHCLFMIDCLFIVLTRKMCVCLLALMRALRTHMPSFGAYFSCAPTCDLPIILLRVLQRVHRTESRHSKHSPDGGCVFDIAKYVFGWGSHLMDLSCMRVLCWCFVFVLLKRSYDDFLRLSSLRHTHEGPIWILFYMH